ncbi:MAG: hypothetical protein U0936_01390 [Planctomycetaceae bacterium]
MKVLIAEDDRFTRGGLVEVLKAKGYRVVVAVDGSEAIQLFQQRKSGFRMPRYHDAWSQWLQACRAIRAQSPDVDHLH